MSQFNQAVETEFCLTAETTMLQLTHVCRKKKLPKLKKTQQCGKNTSIIVFYTFYVRLAKN